MANEIGILKTKEERPTLEQAQEFVGGLVEMISPVHHRDIQLLVNEEGWIRNMEPNKFASEMFGVSLCGPVLVLEGEARWVD